VVNFTPRQLDPRGKSLQYPLGRPRSHLDDVEKRIFLTLPGLELRPLGRPARSQSLYRLRYSGSIVLFVFFLECVTCVIYIEAWWLSIEYLVYYTACCKGMGEEAM
jgi:hypothetical protein